MENFLVSKNYPSKSFGNFFGLGNYPLKTMDNNLSLGNYPSKSLGNITRCPAPLCILLDELTKA